MVHPVLEPYAGHVIDIIECIEFFEAKGIATQDPSEYGPSEYGANDKAMVWVQTAEVEKYINIYHELAVFIFSTLARHNLIVVQADTLSLTSEGRAASRILKLLGSYGPVMSLDNLVQAWNICGYEPDDPGYIEFIVEWLYNNNILIGLEVE